jgi:RecA-family ATPase
MTKPPDANDILRRDGPEGLRLAFDASRPKPREAKRAEPDSLELPVIDVGSWEGADVPEREWIVRDRIIRRNVCLLSGEGGIGKSIIMMQLAVACVAARDWLGSLPEPGPALYLNAEDDERELHFRFNAIARHFEVSFAALKAGGLEPVSLAGKDAVLGAPDRAGIIRSTLLFEALRKRAIALKPVAIALDTAADLFAGNENDRAQVRQFIGLLRRLAIDANCAVALVSHPSVGGIANDSGLSGSTGWHNGPRTRLYFKNPPALDGEANPDLRDLIVKKSNYGPSGEHIRLRWKDGVFVMLGEASTIERAAAEQKADDAFLKVLKRFTEQGRRITDKRGTSYAPAEFAEHPDAAGVTKLELTRAMQRLLDAGRIRVEEDGPRSKRRSRLVLA